jgi:glycosyltransferase involved in cell wall biosynthesis
VKILLLTPFLPYREARAGAPQAVYDRLCLLAPYHDITVVTFAEPGQEAQAADLLSLGVKVDYVMRTPARSGLALWRKRLLLARALLSGSLPLLVVEFGHLSVERIVEHSLETEKPDLLLVEHMLMAQYVSHTCGRRDVPVVISDHDVQAGTATKIAQPTRVSRWLGRIERRRWSRYAERAWQSAQAVLVSSDSDAGVVRRRVPTASVEVAPFGVAPRTVCGEERQDRDDSTLLFVGNFDHPPNREAAERLAQVIMPIVRRACPAARLMLVGKNPTPGVRALQTAGSGVVVTGEVPSVDHYLCSCALFVAPLYTGGGMRIKLMEAMLAGAPIVTTGLGARGLDARNGTHLLVANDDLEFAQAVVSALADRALRERLGREALQLARAPEQRAQRAAHLNNILQRYAGK